MMTEEAQIEDIRKKEQKQHQALRNALYHTARRRWLESWSKFFNFLIILLGSSAATQIFDYIPNSTQYFALTITTVGALQLVYDFSGRARTHALLQKRYYDLLANIEEQAATAENSKAWSAEISRMAGEEPPTMRALDAVADNQATSVLFGGGQRLKITWWENASRQLIAHNGSSFEIREDWEPGHISIDDDQEDNE